MKVLHVIDNLSVGGAERVALNLCNWLFNQGTNVELLVIDGRDLSLLSVLHDDIPVHIIRRKSKFGLYAALRTIGILSKSDVGHVHMRHNYRYTRFLQKIFYCNTPLILHDHSSSLIKPFALSSLLRPKWYIGTSKFSIGYAEEVLNMRSNIYMLENVIEKDTNFVKICSPKTLVHVSNIKPMKNQNHVLDILIRSSWDVQFIGNVLNQSYYDDLKNAISYKGLSERIGFKVDVSNVQPHLPNYQLGLHTSYNETGPLVIIEYLAQGIPFLAFKTGAAADKISSRFPEFFIDNWEVENWVTRIEFLLNNPVDKAILTRYYEENFGKSNYIEKCQKIYREVLHC